MAFTRCTGVSTPLRGVNTKANGLMLTQAPSVTASSEPFIELFSNWSPNGTGEQTARRCGGNVTASPVFADMVGRLSTKLPVIVLPGQKVSVTYRYRRI